jgi:Zn-dependent protease with chaperone function
LRTRDEHAGRRLRCPKCESPIAVPTVDTARSEPRQEPTASNSSTTEEPTRTKTRSNSLPEDQKARYQKLETNVIRAIAGEIDPVRTPFAYRIGILLALSVMVVLPLIYLALIGAVGYAVYWHAVTNTGLLTSDLGASRTSAKARLFAVLLYLASMAVGVILVLFMFKPLLSRPQKRRGPRALSREKEPLLFAFVDRLCDAVHAPRPKRIDVDLQVNASASFRSGMLSMLGSDLVLTIGIPLLASLNMRQFGGVLAHEFGHFSQGAGMRTTYVVRTISHWFARVVYERDAWDEKLTELSHEVDFRIGWILFLARGFVWITRRVLWCLMMVGNAVAGFMLRQMEFDADRHEARFSGSDVFAETQQALPLIGHADQQSWDQLGRFYREGRLVDNLPQLTATNSQSLPGEVQEHFKAVAAETKTALFDTHPADRDRVASAQRENAPGIFRLTYPAAFLFRNFPALCRAATLDLYKELFGKKFDPATMASVDDLIAHQKAEQNDHAALRRFVQGNLTFHRPLRPAAQRITTPDDVDAQIAKLQTLRTRIEKAFPQVADRFETAKKAQSQLTDANRARPLLKAGITISKAAFEIDLSSLQKADSVRDEARETLERVDASLTQFESIASDRLETALSLLRCPEIASRIPDTDQLKKSSRRLLATADVLSSQIDAAIRCLDHQAVIGFCGQILNADSDNVKAGNLLHSQAQELTLAIRGIHRTLLNEDYPFDHAKGSITVAEYILENLPQDGDIGGYYAASDELTGTLLPLYSRTLGNLCSIAERVEEAVGIPALPDPDDDRQDAKSSDA